MRTHSQDTITCVRACMRAFFVNRLHSFRCAKIVPRYEQSHFGNLVSKWEKTRSFIFIYSLLSQHLYVQQLYIQQSDWLVYCVRVRLSTACVIAYCVCVRDCIPRLDTPIKSYILSRNTARNTLTITHLRMHLGVRCA